MPVGGWLATLDAWPALQLATAHGGLKDSVRFDGGGMMRLPPLNRAA
jgi:hypothetical protein